MRHFLITLCVVVLLWTASAAPRAAVDTTASSLPSFEELLSHAKASINSASEHLSEMVGLHKNADGGNSVLDVVKKHSQNYAKELSEVAEKIKTHVAESAKTAEVSEAVKGFQAKIEKTVESLRKQVDLPGEAKQIQEHFTKSLHSVVEEAHKLSKNTIGDKSVSETLHNLSKQVIDGAVKAADTIQNEVHKVTGHKEDHDHKEGHEHHNHQH